MAWSLKNCLDDIRSKSELSLQAKSKRFFQKDVAQSTIPRSEHCTEQSCQLAANFPEFTALAGSIASLFSLPLRIKISGRNMKITTFTERKLRLITVSNDG